MEATSTRLKSATRSVCSSKFKKQIRLIRFSCVNWLQPTAETIAKSFWSIPSAVPPIKTLWDRSMLSTGPPKYCVLHSTLSNSPTLTLSSLKRSSLRACPAVSPCSATSRTIWAISARLNRSVSVGDAVTVPLITTPTISSSFNRSASPTSSKLSPVARHLPKSRQKWPNPKWPFSVRATQLVNLDRHRASISSACLWPVLYSSLLRQSSSAHGPLSGKRNVKLKWSRPPLRTIIGSSILHSPTAHSSPIKSLPQLFNHIINLF